MCRRPTRTRRMPQRGAAARPPRPRRCSPMPTTCSALEIPLARRQLNRAWNAAAQTYSAHRRGCLRLLHRQRAEPLHHPGDAQCPARGRFCRLAAPGPANGEHILAVRLRAGILDGDWGDYVRAYFAGSDAQPANDPQILPTLKLSPCRWMVAAGLAPDLPPGELENAGWDQPDFQSAAGWPTWPPRIPRTPSRWPSQIGWLDGHSESPALMCGPLAWAITAPPGPSHPATAPGITPPSPSGCPNLPKTAGPGRSSRPRPTPCSVSTQPLGSFRPQPYPLEVGDLVYTYSASNGFDHLLVVSESDADGNRFAVTNLVQVKRRPRLFHPAHPALQGGRPGRGHLPQPVGQRPRERPHRRRRLRDLPLGLARQGRQRPAGRLPRPPGRQPAPGGGALAHPARADRLGQRPGPQARPCRWGRN